MKNLSLKKLERWWTPFTWLLVALNLAPIVWMVWVSLMGNNEVLQGKILPAPKSNDLVYITERGAGEYIIGDRNGSVINYNLKSAKYRKIDLSAAAASYWSQGDSLWVLAANNGLSLVNSGNLKVKRQRDWSWFQKKIERDDHTFFTRQNFKKSSFEQEVSYTQLAEMLNHYSLVAGMWRPSLAKTTGVVFPADFTVIDSLNKVLSDGQLVAQALEVWEEYKDWANPVISQLFAQKHRSEAASRDLFRWCLAERFPIKLLRHQQTAWSDVWVSKIPSSGHGTSIAKCADNLLCLALWWDDFPGIAFYDIITEQVDWITLRHGLPTAAIQHLQPLPDGRLLAVSDEGLVLINVVQRDIDQVFLYGEAGLPYLDRSEVQVALLDSHNLLIAYGQELRRFNFVRGLTEPIKFKGLEDLISGVTSLQIQKDKVYLGTAEGLVATDRKFGDYQHIGELFIDENSNLSLDLVIHKIEEFADNLLVLGARGHLVALEPQTGQVWLQQSFPQGWPHLNWRNYQDLWRSIPFGAFLWNSLVISLTVMLIAMVVATFGGYALARFEFPGKKFLNKAIVGTQIIPNILYLIPIFLTFTALQQYLLLNLINTRLGIIIVYTAFFIPMTLWIMQIVFAKLPRELEEAALLDGCSTWSAFVKIVLPVALPSIIAVGGYIFLLAWDELMFAWVLSTDLTSATIPVGIRLTAGQFHNRYDLLMAAATIATMPMLLLFIILNKHLARGVNGLSDGVS